MEEESQKIDHFYEGAHVMMPTPGYDRPYKETLHLDHFPFLYISMTPSRCNTSFQEPKEIDIILSQVDNQVSREEAIRQYELHNRDMVDTILHLVNLCNCKKDDWEITDIDDTFIECVLESVGEGFTKEQVIKVAEMYHGSFSKAVDSVSKLLLDITSVLSQLHGDISYEEVKKELDNRNGNIMRTVNHFVARDFCFYRLDFSPCWDKSF